jgi:hypothetical protein
LNAPLRKRVRAAISSVSLSVLLLAVGGCASSPPSWEKKQAIGRDFQVRDNMRLVQMAAENYAGDHGGNSYPLKVDDMFKTYFRGGVEGQTPSPVGTVNPFTGTNKFPVLGSISDPLSARFGPRFDITPGEVQYSPLASGKGYAIVGGAHDGMVLMDAYNPGQVLVFTNYQH